jgi:hypothetical protein
MEDYWGAKENGTGPAELATTAIDDIDMIE